MAGLDPGVKSMAADGAFSVGSKFRWSAGPGMIRSEVVTADRASTAAWKGQHGGIDAVHVWTIAPIGPTTTHVHTEESWSGLLPRVLRKMLQNTLKKSIDKALAAIKAETERRTRL